MALHLVTGRAAAGKTGILHDAVLEAARSFRRAVVLLPTSADVGRTRTEFVLKQVVGVEIATFDNWAASLWSLYGDGRRLVHPAARAALAAAVTREAPGSLSQLSGAPGLSRLVTELVARIAGSERVARPTGVDRDLFSLADSYFARLSAEALVEPGEAMNTLAAQSCVRGACIAVNRFTDVSPAQERLITGLALDNEVFLGLTWEKGASATQALDPLAGRLSELAVEHVRLEPPPSDTELGAVESLLFDPTGEPIATLGEVVLAEAAGVEAEASLAADLVADIIASGTSPDRIAIAFRDLAPRAALLGAALSDRGIDAVIDVAVPFARSGLGEALTRLLSVGAGTGGRSQLLAYLHSPFCGATASEVERFDATCRKDRIVAGATLLSTASRMISASAEPIRIAEGLVNRPVNECADEWLGLASALMEASAGPSRPTLEREIDRRAHAQLVEAVGAVAGLATSIDPSVLLGSLAEMSVGSGGRERPGAVYVTGVHRLRSRRFDGVVLGGLTASEFSSEAAEPLLVSVLDRAGLASGTDETLSERLLFYSVVTRARRRLVLLRQSSDSTGRELRPSAFWDEICDLYKTREQAREGETGTLSVTHELPLSRLASAAPSFNPGRRALREDVSVGAGPPRVERGRLSPGAGAVAADGELSVTDLETYHACPYRWFYDRVIRPSVLDQSFDARSRGSYCHRIMSEFYGRFRQEVAPRVLPDNLEEALALLEDVMASIGDALRTGPHGLMEELAASSGREWARSTVSQDAVLFEGFEPTCEEKRFGAASGEPATFGGVRLKGSIDRIDVGPAGAIVTDYKSSTSVHGRRSFDTYGLLQAVVYADVAERLLGVPVVSSVYRSLPTGAVRGYWRGDGPESCLPRNDTVDAEELAELKARALKAVAEAANGMLAGDISRRPRRSDACEWCGAKAFCEGAR